MFRIMIVDDEHIIRKGLINFIDWTALECEVIAEAENGILAKDLLLSKAPDIVITDIKMPGIDGIELAKYIFKNHPSIKVILLTGYSDFEYAQSAIKYNVVDFVLKPSSTEKIIEAVNKAKNLIIEKQISKNKLINLKNEIEKNHSEIQEKFILDLMNGVFLNKSFIQEKIQQLKICLDNYYVIIYEIDDISNIKSNNDNVQSQNIILKIKNFVSIVFKDFHHYTPIISSNSLCTLISFKDNNHNINIEHILNNSHKILNFVNDFISIHVSIGISDMHSLPDEIEIAFSEASKCLSYKFYDDKKIFLYSECKTYQYNYEKINTNNYTDLIMKTIESNNCNEAIDIVHKLFEYQKNMMHPADYIKTTGILICSHCYKLLDKYNLKPSDDIKNIDSIYESILESKSISKLSKIVEKVVLSVTCCLASLNTQSNYIIEKSMNYINENYQNPITLTKLADFVHVNSSYLSRLFKKKTGTTLTETITKIRIEKAKELLINRNYKTYEIASMVGFEDPAYFSQVFKKYTGLSPNHYRRK